MKSVSLASLLILCAATAAQAQTPTPRTLTREELRVCVDSQADIATRRSAIDARKQKIAPDLTAMKAEQAELDEERKNIREDEYQKQDRFNRKIRNHNTKFEPVRKTAQEIDADQAALVKSVAAYNEKCVGVAYSKEDMEAVQKERAPKQ